MTPAGIGAARLAVFISKRWVKGSTLRIAFLGGTNRQREMFKEFSPEWTKYANLNFEFVTSGPSECRVAFVEGDGSWSYVGTDCTEIPQDQPTMNLGWDEPGTYRHEVGHFIGAVHEHQSPESGYKWNRENVIADLSGPPNNWSVEQIEFNVIDKYSRDIVNGSVFDPDSNMLYPFPPSWTLDGFHTKENNELSAMDKVFIANMYPRLVVPVEDNIIPVSFVTEKAASITAAGEEDLYLLRAEKDGRYTVATHGDTDCFMSVYGPVSKTALIAKDDDSGVDRNALLTLDLQAGEYWVSVRHYSKRGKGDYRISATASAIA